MRTKENVYNFLCNCTCLLVTGLLLQPSTEHFITPPAWCQLATMCNHTGLSKCAQDIKQGNLTHIKLFLDECDMFEYNCDNVKDYKEVDMIQCQNTSTLSSTTENTIFATTTLTTTTSASSSYVNSTINSNATTSALHTTLVEVTKDQTIPSTQHCTRHLNISSTTSSTVTTPLITTMSATRNCTREANQTSSTEINATKSSLSLNSLSLTTLLSVTNVTEPVILESSISTKPLIANDSIVNFECTRHNNVSTSSLSTVTIENIRLTTPEIPIVKNVTKNCTRNSIETETTAALPDIPTSTTVSTMTSLLTRTSLITTEISTLVTNVIEPPILEPNATTKKNSSDCTRHTKSTDLITTDVASTLPITLNSSTIITAEDITTTSIRNVNESESVTEPKTSAIDNCTRNHNNTGTTVFISSTNNIHQVSTTAEATKPMTITNATKTSVKCEKYPKECTRPSTWDTTARGETRDFFQILRAKFGTRVRLLRATTHWPVRMPFIINDGHFLFGRHSET